MTDFGAEALLAHYEILTRPWSFARISGPLCKEQAVVAVLLRICPLACRSVARPCRSDYRSFTHTCDHGRAPGSASEHGFSIRGIASTFSGASVASLPTLTSIVRGGTSNISVM